MSARRFVRWKRGGGGEQEGDRGFEDVLLRVGGGGGERIFTVKPSDFS